MQLSRLTFGSLFAGIGGFDLGLERAGMECKWQVEIDEYANRILERHWPDVQRWPDVRTWPQPDTEHVDIICGGFPCQDISSAGKRVGIEGERSGLWKEACRIFCDLRPKYVLVENVAALLVRGMGTVLGDLAESGYDAEWGVLSAGALGAEHIRERCFIVGILRDAKGLRGWPAIKPVSCKESDDGRSCQRPRWPDMPAVRGAVDGFPGRVDEIRGLGNSVCPPVAEWLGRRIIEIEAAA